MIDKHKILKIPKEEKNFIDPRLRPKFFMDLIQEYQKRYPQLQLLYAYLNVDPKFPADYVVLFKTKNDAGTIDLIVYDMPLIFSDRSLPGYRYCKRENLLNDFFKEATDSAVRLSFVRFNEFVNSMLLLSADPNDEKYWVKPEYGIRIAQGLLDMSLRYNKK